MEYRTEIRGVENEAVYQQLYESSQTITLQNSLPATVISLKKRAETDIPLFSKILLSHGHYNARVNLDIQEANGQTVVLFLIDPGPIYPFVGFSLQRAENDPGTFPYERLSCANLGVIIGNPALPKVILEAEDNLLKILTRSSYPLAQVEQKEVIADQATKTITVNFFVNSGPLCVFGPTKIVGNNDIKDSFFYKKLAWREGELYDPSKIEETQIDLEMSALLSGIAISHGEQLLEDGTLPMEIEVVEGKFRSVGAGIGYSTLYGPGFSAEWEHRNLRSVGERLTFRADVWTESHTGKISYLIPDIFRRRQNLVWLLEIQHDHTEGYTEDYFSLGGTFDWQLTKRSRVAYGALFKFLRNTRSDNNGEFNLVKFPCQYWWSSADNSLNPTRGVSLNLKLTPSFQVKGDQFSYYIHQFIGAIYFPLTPCGRTVLAFKANIGSIFGSSREIIPPSERFYAGSENTLRGYKYLSVSPLDHDRDPIGGRSLMIYSAEARFRASENIGWVLFYDIGNVYRWYIPQFNHKQLQDIGIGLRYFTPIGPLRLDLAFPLNRRRHIDGPFQIYISIGQAF